MIILHLPAGLDCLGRPTGGFFDGLQQLVAEVSLGNAGIVVGLEVSRLARNNADWHRLFQLCAFTDTLILDQATGKLLADMVNDRNIYSFSCSP